MRIDASRAIGGYAAVMTLAVAWLALGAVAAPAPDARFGVIDVERINVREPDGTFRLAIADHARLPGITVGGREYPHPNRPEAGMIFFNDHGDENGGLVFNGNADGARPTNGGSLTFDRYRQDQTVQMVSEEDGRDRRAGFAVFDRPNDPIDLPAMLRVVAMPPGAARDRASAAAHLSGGRSRLWLGRSTDGVSGLELKDGAGRVRLRLRVDADGAARIDFLNAAERVTRSVC